MQASSLHLANLSYSLEEIDEKIEDAKKCETLFIENAELLTVPPKLFGLTHLTVLDLNDNRLSKVEGIEALSRLQCLVLRTNILVSIPTQLCLIHLVVLDLSYNELTLLPNDFGTSLTSLKQLNLSHNKIGCLPNSIMMLRNLENLNISYNCLFALQVGLSLPKLTLLNANYNQLQSVILGDMPELKLINFLNNPIENIFGVQGNTRILRHEPTSS